MRVAVFAAVAIIGCAGPANRAVRSAASNENPPLVSSVVAFVPTATPAAYAAGIGARQEMVAAEPPAEQNVVQVIQADPRFRFLTRAIIVSGLRKSLKAAGPYTIFAPTDAAFARLPAKQRQNLLRPANKERLATLLRAHILPRRVTGEDINALSSETRLEALGGWVQIKKDGAHDDGRFDVNGAEVIQPDIPATNGVVHAVNALLIPVPQEQKNTLVGIHGSRGRYRKIPSGADRIVPVASGSPAPVSHKESFK